MKSFIFVSTIYTNEEEVNHSNNHQEPESRLQDRSPEAGWKRGHACFINVAARTWVFCSYVFVLYFVYYVLGHCALILCGYGTSSINTINV